MLGATFEAEDAVQETMLRAWRSRIEPIPTAAPCRPTVIPPTSRSPGSRSAAGFLTTMGTLGDRIGRRKVLLIGATAFGALSLLPAFSTSTEMLIASRALLGIAGATLAPSTLSLIISMFQDPGQRARAIAIWAFVCLGGA